jgi:hypothetical protein
VRHGRTADGGDELSSHLDDSGMFGLGADHESGDIVKEDYWCVSGRVSLLFVEAELESLLLVTYPYELRGLSSFVRIDNR